MLHDFGRCQCVDHELRGVGGPQNDVHPLPGELRRDRLNARTAHPDASADRIDTLIIGFDRDLGSHARITSGSFHIQKSFFDLGNFELEELGQKIGNDTRQHELGSATAAVHLQQESAHPVADPEVLLRDHLVSRQNRLDSPRLHDGVAALDALDSARYKVFLTREEIAQNLLALRIPNFLQDDLLRSLRADAPELDGLERFFLITVQLESRVLFFGLRERQFPLGCLQSLLGYHMPAAKRTIVASLAIDLHANVDILAKALLRG